MKALLLLILLFGCCNFCTAQEQLELFSYNKKSTYSELLVYSYEDTDTKQKTSKYVIDGFDSRIPFYIFSPLNINSNSYVIYLHGGMGSKEMIPIEKKLKDSLVALGYNVLVPDTKFHGERTYELNFRPFWTLKPEEVNILSDMFSKTVKDVRILMDYIESKNANEKINFHITGGSFGGINSTLVNAVDERPQSVVAMIVTIDLKKLAKAIFKWSEETTIQLEGVSIGNYGKYQKVPISNLFGKKDESNTPEELDKYFQSIGIEDKELKFFDSGHELTDDMISEAIKWITKHNKK